MIGTSNKTTLSYIKETEKGVTPTSPEMQLMRFQGETLQRNFTTTESEEIRDDRGVSDLIIVDQSNTGEVTAEFSGATWDDFLLAALMSDDDWTETTVSGTTIEATSDSFTDSDEGFGDFQIGQTVKVSGFANDAINGYYRITSVSDGEIEVTPSPGATASAGENVTVEGSTAVNGSTDHTFTIQKAFKDIQTPAYMNFRGCAVSNFTLGLSQGAKVTCGFSFMGMSSETTTTQISGLTEKAKTTTRIMNSVTNASQILAESEGITSPAHFTEFSLTYDNALRELKAIGTLGSVDVRAGTINATMNLNPYFENVEMLEAFENSDDFSLSFRLTSGDGYSYVFSFPRVKFSNQGLQAGGRNQDLIINGQTLALLDEHGVTLRIDRFAP